MSAKASIFGVSFPLHRDDFTEGVVLFAIRQAVAGGSAPAIFTLFFCWKLLFFLNKVIVPNI